MVRDLYDEALVYMRPDHYTNMVVSDDLAKLFGIQYAARQTAAAMLNEARKVGVTDEQYEALRKVAAEVAYD